MFAFSAAFFFKSRALVSRVGHTEPAVAAARGTAGLAAPPGGTARAAAAPWQRYLLLTHKTERNFIANVSKPQKRKKKVPSHRTGEKTAG